MKNVKSAGKKRRTAGGAALLRPLPSRPGDAPALKEALPPSAAPRRPGDAPNFLERRLTAPVEPPLPVHAAKTDMTKTGRAEISLTKINGADKDVGDSEGTVYDFVRSQELFGLQEKTRRLLDRLSSTGRTNSILQTELCSLIEERSRAALDNNRLKAETALLRKTVSRFRDRERLFYEQSLRLKGQVQGLSGEAKDPHSLSRALLKSREKAFSEKLIRFLRYRQKVKKAHGRLKEHQAEQKEKIRSLEEEIKRLADGEKPADSKTAAGAGFQYVREDKENFQAGSKTQLYRLDSLKNQETRRRKDPAVHFLRPPYQEESRLSEKPDLQNRSSQTRLSQTRLSETSLAKPASKKTDPETNKTSAAVSSARDRSKAQNPPAALLMKNGSPSASSSATKSLESGSPQGSLPDSLNGKKPDYQKQVFFLIQKLKENRAALQAAREKSSRFKILERRFREAQKAAMESGRLTDENRLLKENICFLEEEARRLAEQEIGLSAKLIPLMKYRKKVQAAHPRLKNALQHLKRREAALSQEKTALQKQTEDFQKETRSLGKQKEELQKNFAEREARIASLKNETASLKKKLQSPAFAKPAVAKQVKELKARLKERDLQIKKSIDREAARRAEQEAELKEKERQIKKSERRAAAEREERDARLKEKDLQLKNQEKAALKEREKLQAALRKKDLHIRKSEEKIKKSAEREAKIYEARQIRLKERELQIQKSEEAAAKKIEKQEAGLKERDRLIKKQKSAEALARKNLKTELKESARQVRKLLKEARFAEEREEHLKQKLQKTLEDVSQDQEGRQKTELALKEKLNKAQAFLRKKESALKQSDALCADFRLTLTQQQEGFTDLIRSYQAKAIDQKKLLADKEGERQKISRELKEQIARLQNKLQQAEEERETLKLSGEKRLKIFQSEQEGSKAYAKDLEREIVKIKKASVLALTEKEKVFEAKAAEEILRYKKRLKAVQEESLRSADRLQSEHERRAENLRRAQDIRLRRLTAEKENDLLSEAKRLETLKAVKNRRIKSLESDLKLFQEEAHKNKAALLTERKARRADEESLKKEILSNGALKRENKKLKSLWENLQRESEARSQQVLSLQKLNRDLSRMLNRSRSLEKTLKSGSSVPPPLP